jgi:hypothetical protein
LQLWRASTEEVIGMHTLVETGEDWIERAYPRAVEVLRERSERKTGFSNAEVKLLWEHGREARSGNGSLWSDGVRLYSYSTPIATRCRNGVLVNTHFYSVTTNCHRPWVDGALNIDFEILGNWVAPSDLEDLCILDEGEDAALLLKNGDGDDHNYILMLRDGGREYGVELPKPCRTVDGAKKMLVPSAAKKALDEGRTVRRQGEWYFIPFPEIGFSRDAVEHPLRRGVLRDRYLDNHIPREKVAWAFSIEEASESEYFDDSAVCVFVRGTVRHTRGDHRMLRLGETWHLAVRSPLRGVTAARVRD